MILCIAEKPSVAGDLAAVLGATTRREGYYEGNNYCVTYTYGHLCTLKEPHDYTAMWKAWSISTLPMMPSRFGIKLIDNDGVRRQFNVIKELIARADEVINCGDAGQEGELIQRWVMQLAGCKCPVRRLWISSLTYDAISAGFQSLQPQEAFDNLYHAGLARAIGDWLLGMNATRAYTLRYGKNRQVLSIGRVQTPTLALIVNRAKEIEQFKSELYWELKTEYRGVLFSSTKGKFNKEEEAAEIIRQISDKPLIITDIIKKEGAEQAPKLFDLTSLQVECNRKFSLSADTTLKTIQSLYEKKLTTYPRVDTTFLSEDLHPKIAPILSGLKGYEELTSLPLSAPIPKSKRIFDNSKVTDHHAIIPTGVSGVTMTETEQLVYDLVVRHFIANFYPPCKFDTTTVSAAVEEYDFKATGKTITDKGWKVVFESAAPIGVAMGEDDKEKSEENQTLPAFTVGESGGHKPLLAQKKTSPPKLYTEATLLRAMETAGKTVEDEALRLAMKENGIGRPSTRAAIIELLFKRNYIRKIRKAIEPTQTGIDLINIISEPIIKSAELTGQWEYKLRQIEKGNYDSAQFMTELKDMVNTVIHNVLTTNNNVRIGENELVKDLKEKSKTKASKKKPVIKEGMACPKCGKGLIIRGKSMFGCSCWREGCDWRHPFND